LLTGSTSAVTVRAADVTLLDFLKDFGPGELVGAIQRVYHGESWLHPAIALKVLQELAQPPQGPLTPDPLTSREVDVLRLVAHGDSNQEIAAVLALTEGTVRWHINHILNKLHLANRTQAALYALREGLAALDDTGPAG